MTAASAPLVLALSPAAALGAALAGACRFETGTLEQRRFPDGESYVRVPGEVAGRVVVLVAQLHHPDEFVVPLLFAASTCRELGATRVVLVAPYLPYMRQDTRFHDGEAVTARLFASLLSSHVDAIVTVDPHLHRIGSLSEVFSVPAYAVPAAPALADWVRGNVSNPLLVGPDAESEQWVSEVARLTPAPWFCLRKTRSGDRKVTIEPPPQGILDGRTPVLLDDIISTATTMARAAALLRQAGGIHPVCMAVHPLFAHGADDALRAAGAQRVVTCDTIVHPTNAVSVLAPLARTLEQAVAVGFRPLSSS